MFSSYLEKSAFLIPFAICLVISGAILWYERMRQPIKKFRTPFGQLLLTGVILLMVSGGVSFFVAKSILTGDEVVQSLKKEEEKGYDPAKPMPWDPSGQRKGGSWDRLKHGPNSVEAEESAGAQDP